MIPAAGEANRFSGGTLLRYEIQDTRYSSTVGTGLRTVPYQVMVCMRVGIFGGVTVSFIRLCGESRVR